MGLSDINLTDIDFETVAACTQPRVLRRYIKLLEEDGGYFYQLLHAAREKLASLTGCKPRGLATGVGGGASAAEIAAARQDLLQWQCSLKSPITPVSDHETAPTLGSTSDAIEEVKDEARGAEEAMQGDGERADGKKATNSRVTRIYLDEERDQKEYKQESGKNRVKENDEMKITHWEARIPRGNNSGGHKITPDDTRWPCKRQSNEEKVEQVTSSEGQEVEKESFSLRQAEQRMQGAETQVHVAESVSLVDTTLHPGENTQKRASAGECSCLPVELQASDVKHEEKVEKRVCGSTLTTERRYREGNAELNTSDCASECRSYSGKRQMQKICLYVEDEGDTEDESSDEANSEDD